MRLRIHRALHFPRPRVRDDVPERGVLRAERRALHEDVPRALLRGQLPEEHDVHRGRVVEREDGGVQPRGDVGVRGGGGERGHRAAAAVQEVAGGGGVEGDGVGVLWCGGLGGLGGFRRVDGAD